MMTNISNRIYYVGTNDRAKSLFENNWPLPNGVSYNSYLISDKRSALIDTIEYGSNGEYLSTIEKHLCSKKLDFLIVNHMEPDHSSMTGEVLRRYPEIKIVGNAKTFKILKSFFPVHEENLYLVEDGDTLDLGYHKLKFVYTPWVHWPETMMTYDMSDEVLFSCDGFGSFGTLDGGIFDDTANFDFYEPEMRRYYSNIVGKWSMMVQKALEKLSGTPIKTVCPSHGLIFRKDPSKVISLYDKWSRHKSDKGVVIAYASMYGNTEKMADKIGRAISDEGIRDIRIFDVSKTHPSFILSEIWKYRGLILGSCAYNTMMHPMMNTLTEEILISAPKNKVLGLFGSSSWNGAGVKCLLQFASKAGLPVTGTPLELFGAPNDDKMSNVSIFAEKFVKEL